MEGDPRHAELVIEQLNLQDTPSLSSPGIDTEEPEENAEDDEELDSVSAKQYRGIAARCNYLSSDRPELQFSVKDACREMSKPTVHSWSKLIRIGRYLKAQPCLVCRFPLHLARVHQRRP